MSVWPGSSPVPSPLSTPEGALVSVSITVDPRNLEILLEALASVSFPINPQIYHDAAVVYRYADGSETSEAVTLVEFPAYEGRLSEARSALERYAFDPGAMQATGMLDDIHAERVAESVPDGATYVSRYRVKRRAAAAVH